ncbi:GNAT family N-acetyltransferase, partial [Clostridium sp. UBA6640]|uniref:GNAT family N-acetyltransferase n=1 Tax=Clostridium sp. UBA6640 TaxID=1946370 RepID=UPI0025BECAE2
MRAIKRLEECYIEGFVEIAANAYPGNGIFTKEDKERFKNNIIKTQNEKPNVNFYGVFEDSILLGGMSYHDFNMNLLNKKIKAGGVGCIAVDLIHKKEKVAIDIIKDFIYHYRNQGAPMALLYPFRPDFYKKMGFGFGTSINQFRVKPCNLPKGTSKMHIEFLNIEDLHELCNFYNKMVMRTNGLIEKYDYEFKILFDNTLNKILAYKVKDEIKGYVVFQFKKGDTEAFTINDIVI